MEHKTALTEGLDSVELARLESTFAEEIVRLPSAAGESTGDVAQIGCRRGGGQGPVIVLLHGISSGAPSWLPCASLLAGHARVLAWDAPGYGNSTPLPAEAPMAADYARSLQAMLRVLDLRPDVIVGHSLGAPMAAAYVAQADPQWLPSRLLLVSPAQGYGGPGQEEKSRQVAVRRLEALERLGVPGLAARGPERLLGPDADEGARAWVRRNMERLDPAGYRQAVAMLCGDAIDRYLQARPAGLDVRVACGAQDVVTPPDACAALAERFGLPFTLIPDAGHACYVEQGAAVARWIRAA